MGPAGAGAAEARTRAITIRPVLALATLLVLAGCGGSSTPRVALHSKCVACSMDIEDLRFACTRMVEGRWRSYDSIECLIRDAGTHLGGAAWLADYDTRALWPADSLWVVKGEFPSPMSGGFAAFMHRASAESVAVETRGAVDRFSAWAAKGWP